MLILNGLAYESDLKMKFHQHLTSLLARHKAGVFLSFLLAGVLLILGSLEASLMKTTSYLLVMFGGFLLSEFIYYKRNADFKGWQIKRPRKELWVVILAVSVASMLFIFWFIIVDQNTVSRTTSVVALILRVLFVFPVFLLVFFLGFKKYKPGEIGIWGFRFWFVSIPIIMLLGGVSYLLFPEGMQFKQQLQHLQ